MRRPLGETGARQRLERLGRRSFRAKLGRDASEELGERPGETLDSQAMRDVQKVEEESRTKGGGRDSGQQADEFLRTEGFGEEGHVQLHYVPGSLGGPGWFGWRGVSPVPRTSYRPNSDPNAMNKIDNVQDFCRNCDHEPAILLRPLRKPDIANGNLKTEGLSDAPKAL